MSDVTVAKWNAIPMDRPTDDYNMKRSRPENDDSDDDVSLVSRSPSPEPEGMDVDPDTYREHVRGAVREVITVETRIKPENRGFALLAKMGWSEGKPLGLSADGRVDPIPFQLKNDSTGIGKITQDIRMIETTVSQRKDLEAERQRKETEEQRKAREDLVARKTAVESEISSVLRAFYCELCDKQFKTVAQYDEHTNSYGHHHKARLRDMTANARPTSKDDLDKRKEKERRREEKELRKIAKAAGVKMPKLPAPSSGMPATVPISEPITSSSSSQGGIASEFSQPKKDGWTTIGATTPTGFKKSGWATVGSATQASSSGFSTLPSAPTGAQTTTDVPSYTAGNSHTSSAHVFRNAGWTSLDTASSQQPQPPVPLSAPHPPPTQPSAPQTPSQAQIQAPPTAVTPSPATTATSRPSGGGWKQFQSSLRGKNRR